MQDEATEQCIARLHELSTGKSWEEAKGEEHGGTRGKLALPCGTGKIWMRRTIVCREGRGRQERPHGKVPE